MSHRELDRMQVLVRVQEKRLTQRQAARILRVSERQLRRLWQVYKRDGADGLANGHRGRPSNRRLPATTRERALALVREHYADFGPTFAHEKLTEVHGLELSVSALRRWMIETELWIPRSRRRRIHQPRNRRECYGELIQIDGSEHHWFEDRGPKCTLLVYIDDATSSLMQLHFCESESAFSYFAATRGYMKQHGKPVAFYSDKASVFRVNAKQPKSGDGFTQFGRAMGDLNVDTMCANTPQAKGRVERANGTLQNRLVKELRLAGISTIEAANAFAAKFVEDYNRRFARPALNPHDAHRPLRPDEDLDRVFTWREQRKVTQALALHYNRALYLLDKTDAARDAIGKYIDVIEYEDGRVAFMHRNVELSAQEFRKEGHVRQAAIVDNKALSAALKYAAAQQEERDAQKLKRRSFTKRDRKLLEQRKAKAGQEVTRTAGRVAIGDGKLPEDNLAAAARDPLSVISETIARTAAGGLSPTPRRSKPRRASQ